MRKGALTHRQVNRQNVRNVQARVAGTVLSRDQLAFQAQRTDVTGLSPMQRLHCTPLVGFKNGDICSTHGPGVDDELAALGLGEYPLGSILVEPGRAREVGLAGMVDIKALAQ